MLTHAEGIVAKWNGVKVPALVTAWIETICEQDTMVEALKPNATAAKASAKSSARPVAEPKFAAEAKLAPSTKEK